MLFYVQGSEKIPYKLEATGSGRTFDLACSCPFGRKTGKQCKHARALLYGDVSDLVAGSDDVVALGKLAEGSPALAEAMSRPLDKAQQQAVLRRPPEGVDSVKALYNAGCSEIARSGLTPQYSEGSEPWAWQTLLLHDHFKNGKVKKGPAVVLSWEESTGESVVQKDGGFAYENVRARQRPYTLRGKKVRTTSRKRFADVYNDLMEALDGGVK